MYYNHIIYHHWGAIFMFFSVLKNTCASSNNTWQRHHSRTPHILLFYTCVKGQDDDEVLEREEKWIKTKSKKKSREEKVQCRSRRRIFAATKRHLSISLLLYIQVALLAVWYEKRIFLVAVIEFLYMCKAMMMLIA